MKFIDKERTFAERQFLSFLLWNIMLAFAVCLVVALYNIPVLSVPLLLVVFLLYKLIGDNKKLMIEKAKD